MWLSTHQAVFDWVLKLLESEGRVRGKTVSVDATTLEANPAMRSIERRDTGESHDEYLKGLAEQAGMESPTREQLARFDRTRTKKASNKDWKHPRDPDARITKMKDGRTHLAHKAEHAVDLDTGALLATTLPPADVGDTTTIYETPDAAENAVEKLGAERELTEVVTDKGYHSEDVMVGLKERGLCSHASEPARGRQRWKGEEAEQAAVYANRRRLRGARNNGRHEAPAVFAPSGIASYTPDRPLSMPCAAPDCRRAVSTASRSPAGCFRSPHDHNHFYHGLLGTRARAGRVPRTSACHAVVRRAHVPASEDEDRPARVAVSGPVR